MTELWLVRHGQTDWNLSGRLQGQTDIPLNETGLAQARDLAARLDGQAFCALFSSDLKRAAQTAEILGRHLRLDVRPHRGLRELCFGEWEGLTVEEIRQNYPELVARRQADPLDVPPPGGESDRELARRMRAAADEITAACPVGPVLVVSHGRALAVLICLACGYPLEEAREHGLDNALPRVVQWDPEKA